MSEPAYMQIVRHYEACLERHGDNHLGVDWPDAADAEKRYRVMLDVVREPRPKPVSLLDFGCGLSHLLDYIRRHSVHGIEYHGLDASARFVQESRKKYPAVSYYELDILTNDRTLPYFDYIVMNGVFTEKQSLPYSQMFDFLDAAVSVVFAHARKGVAFNLMSKHVDWERDDLFHVPFDEAAGMIRSRLSRNFVFRNDYGLYEYTAYVYR